MGKLCTLLASVMLLVAAGAETFTEDFANGTDRWQPVKAEDWAIRKDGDNAYYALITVPPLRPGVRRPAEYSLIKDKVWRDVTISTRLMSLRPKTLNGRDCVVIFGWRDDTHFYYVHVSNDSNGGTHNVIMKVDGDKRSVLQKEKKPEPRLKADGWHDVKVLHQADGVIKVWMDDPAKPLMTAQDTSYPDGAVGLGSFDDTAAFDDVKVEGTVVAPAKKD